MFRILAVIGGLVAVILFAIYASDVITHASLLGWGFVAFAAAFTCLALEGIVPVGPWPRGGAQP